MLKFLHIENIAVIEKADIEFASGLNVMTGETGAGKSIVIDAITAVTGGRTSKDIIRTGADAASVTAVFTGGDAWFEDNGLDPDESGDVFMSRKISADGKSTCRVNGAPVAATQMRELGAALLDIHGQNDGRKLLDEGAHIAYLDAYGGLDDARNEYKAAYAALRAKKAEIEKFSMDESEKERRIDTLRYQTEEIERAKIKPGEHDELATRRELLLNASKLTEAVESAFEALYGGDRTDGAVALIGEAQEHLDKASRYSGSARALSERLTDLKYSAQDISDDVRDLRSELEFSPSELDALEARLDTLRRILRKYGSEQEALDHMAKGQAELAEIEDMSDRIAKLEREIDTCAKEAATRAARLSDMRKAAADTLQKQVMDELSQLSMPGARFVVEFGTVSGEYSLRGDGCDDVRFLMSANAGETPGRISRIASGGELARIMLALKSVLSGEQETGTMVFDEVDSGVSGIAAQRVGEKLATLARRRQVLCVTHLPQIAVMADAHFEIKKSVTSGRTFTHIDTLDAEGRKKEIARLSGGENITITTLTSAAEQLAAAEAWKENMRM